jgi:YqzE-like protein
MGTWAYWMGEGGGRMSVNDYVKFLTQTVVQHYNKSPQERKTIRKQRKTRKEPFLYRWFGIIPYAVGLFFKKNKNQ